MKCVIVFKNKDNTNWWDMSLFGISVDRELTDENYKEKFLSSIDECSQEELKQIALLIADYWIKNSSKIALKKQLLPYKSELLYKALGTNVNLDNLPLELRIKLYSYVDHIFN